MNILVYGAGYIGCVNAYCLAAEQGNNVEIIDNDAAKKQNLLGRTPLFYETDFEWDHFYNSIGVRDKVEHDEPDAVVICISCAQENDGYNVSGIEGIIDFHSKSGCAIYVRSTIGPREIGMLERRYQDTDIDIFFWPEFLREGSALKDYRNDKNYLAPISKSKSAGAEIIVGNHILMDSAATLSMVKTYSNYFRALKVSFANQIGKMLNENDLVEDEFYDVFLALRGNCDKLYMKPGDPFGGYCLPKETRYVANELSSVFPVESNIASSVLAANEHIIKSTCDEVVASGVKSMGFFHFPFKSGTSDLRESPTLILARMLEKKIKVYDLDGSSNGAIPSAELGSVQAVFANQNVKNKEYEGKLVFSFDGLLSGSELIEGDVSVVERSSTEAV